MVLFSLFKVVKRTFKDLKMILIHLLLNGDINDFAHIPWEDTPDFPFHPHKERNSQTETVGEGPFWYLPGGPVGEILDERTYFPTKECLPWRKPVQTAKLT